MSNARTTSRFSSIKDLSGKTVGVQAGSALWAVCPNSTRCWRSRAASSARSFEYTSYPEAYQDLALGRWIYVVNTVINLQTLVAEKAHF